MTATVAELAGLFAAAAEEIAEPGPRLDVGPGADLVAVVPGRRLEAARWGMIPMGRTNARGRPVLDTIVNARGETLFSKSAFAGLERCIVPVSGWYEWTGERRRRTRWAIRAPEGLLALAAVRDTWRPPGGGAAVGSLALVTCAPNSEVAAVHDRMPVVLAPAAWALWLGEVPGDPAALIEPPPDGALVVEPA